MSTSTASPRIYVEAKWFTFNSVHLYLVYRDESGNEWVVRSASNGVNIFGGPTIFEINVPIELSADARGDLTPADRYATQLDLGEYSADEAWAIIVRYARTFQAEDYPYEVFGTNSNALVGALTHSIGLTPTDNLPTGINVSDAVGFTSYTDMVADVAPPPNGDVLGTGGADTIDGIQIDERILGLGGNDSLHGGAGNDTIEGGAGDDSVYGGEEHDVLIDGPGDDTYVGGAGSDTVVIDVNRADASVTDLGNGQVEIVSADGTDTVGGVEFFQFNDQTISLHDLFGVTPEPDFLLAVGVAETGYYGNRFMGSTNAEGVIQTAFTGTTEDLLLSVTGFDVDFVGEVEVVLNGASLGYLGTTPDNGTGSSRFDIAAEDQLAGENILEFRQLFDPNYSWGVTDVLIGPPEPDFLLEVGVAETGYYGNRFLGATNADGVIQTAFTGTTEDLSLSVTGFDVDFVGEVEVVLNGASLGYLGTTPDNGTGSSRFDIAAADQLAGENILEFRQLFDPNYSWGVTDVLIGPPEPDFLLEVGVAETGYYGNRFMGATNADGVIQTEFTGTTEDLSLSVTGFDVDFVGEVEVVLNGTSLGYLETTPDNGTGSSRFDIAAADQLAGENILEFRQVSNSIYSWGVTDVLIDEFAFV